MERRGESGSQQQPQPQQQPYQQSPQATQHLAPSPQSYQSYQQQSHPQQLLHQHLQHMQQQLPVQPQQREVRTFAFHLVHEGLPLQLDVQLNPPTTEQELQQVIASRYERLVPGRRIDPESLFFLDEDGNQPRFQLPLSNTLSGAVVDSASSVSRGMRTPIFVAEAREPPKDSQPALPLDYPNPVNVPSAKALIEQPQLQQETFTKLSRASQTLMTMMEHLIQALLGQERGCRAQYKALRLLNRQHAGTTSTLEKNVTPDIQGFEAFEAIADKLKRLLLRVSVQPAYIGLPETEEEVPLLLLHDRFDTEAQFDKWFAKGSKANKKVKKLLALYQREVASHARPFAHEAAIETYRRGRKDLTQQFNALFKQHRRALKELSNMTEMPMKRVLHETLDRQEKLETIVTQVVDLKARMCGFTRQVTWEVMLKEAALHRFWARYNIQEFQHTRRTLHQARRISDQLRHLPHTVFTLMTELFRRQYIKARYIYSLTRMEDAVRNMREAELEKRQNFLSKELIARVPEKWPTFSLLVGYPRSCLKKMRPFDENLPRIAPEKVTEWLDTTEAAARDLGLEEEILDDTWFTLRAENVEKFEAQHQMALGQVKVDGDPFSAMHHASDQMTSHTDAEVTKLQQRIRDLEDDVLALHLELFVKDFLLSSPASSPASNRTSASAPAPRPVVNESITMEDLVTRLQHDKADRAAYRTLLATAPWQSNLVLSGPPGRRSLCPSDDEGSPTPRPYSIASSSSMPGPAAPTYGHQPSSLYIGVSPDTVSPVHTRAFVPPNVTSRLQERLLQVGAGQPSIREVDQESGAGPHGEGHGNTHGADAASTMEGTVEGTAYEVFEEAGGSAEESDAVGKPATAKDASSQEERNKALEAEVAALRTQVSKLTEDKQELEDRVKTMIEPGALLPATIEPQKRGKQRQQGSKQGDEGKSKKHKEEEKGTTTKKKKTDDEEEKEKGATDGTDKTAGHNSKKKKGGSKEGAGKKKEKAKDEEGEQKGGQPEEGQALEPQQSSAVQTAAASISTSMDVSLEERGSITEPEEPHISFMTLHPGHIAMFLRSPKKTCMKAFTKRAREYVIVPQTLVDMGVIRSAKSPLPPAVCVRITSIDKKTVPKGSPLEFLPGIAYYECKGEVVSK